MSLDVFLTQETNGLYPDEEALTPNKTGAFKPTF